MLSKEAVCRPSQYGNPAKRLMNSFPTCDFTVVTNLELFWQVDLKSG
jgi:hypothetical protein